jgi:hypothetical protein
LLSWIGHKRGGIQPIRNIVKHSTPAGPRINSDETRLTNFHVRECENLRFFSEYTMAMGAVRIITMLDLGIATLAYDTKSTVPIDL